MFNENTDRFAGGRAMPFASKRVAASLILLAALSMISCGAAKTPGDAPAVRPPTLAEEAGAPLNELRAVVLHAGDGDAWRDDFSLLSRSLLLNLRAEAVDAEREGGFSLAGCDALFLDDSVIDSPAAEEVRRAVVEYARNGGCVFLGNRFHDFFPPEFLGAESFVKLDGFPGDMRFPEAPRNMIDMQKIIKDFSDLYPSYVDFEAVFSKCDYGYAMRPDTAVPLAVSRDLAVYAVNPYGAGFVFFANPMLPNEYTGSSFLLRDSDTRPYFTDTGVSAAQILLSEFAAFAAKERDGFAVKRVFGSFGRPSISWQLHIEEITGIANRSMEAFFALCKPQNQIPSYSLQRNIYYWFLRAESVTFLPNEGEDGRMAFEADRYENVYSTGRHLVFQEDWLRFGEIYNTESYFEDYEKYSQNAYPCFGDLDGDGADEMAVGCADGYFYCFEDDGYDGDYKVKNGERLKNAAGKDISVDGPSAPALIDADGDGVLDIVSGSSDGRLYWFSGKGERRFDAEGVLLSVDGAGRLFPAAGDIDGDGNPDLLVGADTREIFCYYGGAASGEKSPLFDADRGALLLTAPPEITGAHLAPCAADIDGDGLTDILAGTFDGYIARFANRGGVLRFDGFLTGSYANYKGNFNLKFGNNCVPRLHDANGDGRADLVCGQQEYGLAYPLDSKYFPYADALEAQLNMARDNYLYIGLHGFTNAFATERQEKEELDMHTDVFRRLGIRTEGIGANQHTWNTSGVGATQTFSEQWKAGLLWNSGHTPPGADYTPQVAAENAIPYPFFVTDGTNESMLLFNASTFLEGPPAYSETAARYEAPISLYYHCDLMYMNRGAIAGQDIRRVSALTRSHLYNFTREDQMAKAIAAAYNIGASAEIERDAAAASDDGGAGSVSLRLTPYAHRNDFPLYSDEYQASCGVKIVLGEKLSGLRFKTDADVWYEGDDGLYVSLNRETTVSLSAREDDGADEAPHLVSVNIAAAIRASDDGASVYFLDDGMMQARVAGKATSDSEGFDARTEDGYTVFTKYGARDRLDIAYVKP
jgi:hypothetical protein